MSNKRAKVRGRLNTYILWPIYLGILPVIMTLAAFLYSPKAGIIVGGIALLYIIIAAALYFSSKSAIMYGLMDFATSYGQVQRQLLKEFDLPYALLDDSGRFVWQNEAFATVFKKDNFFKKSVTSLVPELTKDKLPTTDEAVDFEFSYEGSDFRANLRKLNMKNLAGHSVLSGGGIFEGSLIAMILFDETELNEYIRRYRDETLVSGVIYIDNYDEVLETIEEVRRSLLGALIERRVNKYFSSYDAIVRRTETDKYFFVMKRKAYDEMCAEKFSLLEDVKNVSLGSGMITVTLSMGFGVDAPSFLESASYAKTAIDLALGRGGDQVVVKTPEKITYYGGKSQQVEKSTRVKARVKAHALREIIESKERVIVMGHSISDVDSFGSAVGIFRASKFLGKKCNIVINEVTTSIRAMMDDFVDSPDYEEGIIINSGEAISLVDSTTALVVVDTNRPGITECPELLNMCKTIVVLDHHRQSSERIENASLSYIEPYASSACEMVAEILQYIGDNIKLKSVEADCLYAGIMIDTNNFMTKTGVRTFEAAAFLRRNGADVTRVRKIFRDDVTDYKARAEAVRRAELYRDEFAISILPSEGIDSPTVVGAQAANELLNINSVKASFIMTQYQGKVFISARSIDEINVQIVMEKLGGGGHMNIAGAQIEGHSPDEVVDILKEVLDSMIEEGEI